MPESNLNLSGHVKLASSNLDSAAYDPASGVLEVRFKNGGQYRYAEVPPEVFEGLKTAESAGRFFAAHVKNAFRFEKLPPPAAPELASQGE